MDTLYFRMLFYRNYNTSISQKPSSVSLKVAEKYASQIMQNFFIGVPVLIVSINSIFNSGLPHPGKVLEFCL